MLRDRRKAKIALLRDDLIRRFKDAEISPQREMELAKIVSPAIDVLQVIYNDAIPKLSR